MTTLDEVLELHRTYALLHYEYDPEKAREYYLRTRQLKGRSPAAAKPLPAVKRPAAVKSGAQLARKPLITGKKSTRAQAQAQVAGIQKRIGALEGVLKSLLAQKKTEDTKKSTEKAKPAAKAGSSADPKRKLTAKQKSDNNKRAKDYYEKNKKPAEKKTAKPDEKSLDEKIAYTRSQIKTLKTQLAAAKVKAGLK